MAPTDLLRPLEGQRQETLRLLEALTEADLDRVDRDSGRNCRQLLAHLAASDLRAVEVIGSALEGEVMHLSQEDRERLAQEHEQTDVDWSLERLRSELASSRQRMHGLFQSMSEEDLDLEVRWPDWPARTIRSSIPYMLEHEDAHLDQVRSALDRD